MAFVISGWDPSYRRPRFIGQIVFGAGQLSAANAPLACLLIGKKTSAGSMTVDAAPVACTTEEEADSLAGAGSELARMAYKALKKKGIKLYLAAVTENGGTAATATLLLAGVPTAAGVIELYIAGERVAADVASGTAVDTYGAAITAAINAKTRLPVTASYNSGTDTVTITTKNKGVSSKDWLIWKNESVKPAGVTMTLTGSAAEGTDRVRMGAAASGTGTDDVTTLLTQLQTGRYARIACATNDATNAALVESHVNTKAGVLSMLYEHAFFGHNGAYAAAQSIAQTTLNAQRCNLKWHRNSESHPCEIAAAMAALSSTTENASPVPDYDGVVLEGIAPQRYDADRPTDTEINTALTNSVSVMDTVDGQAVIVRQICSYSLLAGSTPDDRTLDAGDARFPDYAMLDLKATYDGEFRPNNPHVQDNPASGAKEPPSGVATPDRWNAEVQARMESWFANNWIEDPANNLPVSTYSTSYHAIVTNAPVIVRRVQHQLGVIVRQTAAA